MHREQKSLTGFRYIERGREDTAVLIPGWATDHRIFDSLDINFNYLLPVEFSPFTPLEIRHRPIPSPTASYGAGRCLTSASGGLSLTGFTPLEITTNGVSSKNRGIADTNLLYGKKPGEDSLTGFTFEKSLLTALREYRIAKISLFGWSLGGFWAAEFASKYPYLIDELILVSIRKRYKRQELTKIKSYLTKNKEAYLYKFYTQCFYREDRLYWFRENLFENYCRRFDLDYLFTALDYLKEKEISPAALKEIRKIKIIHGEFDRIAPMKEAMDIKRSLPQAEFIRLRRTGHIPFLETDFNICSIKR